MTKMYNYASPTSPGGYRRCWLCERLKALTAFPRVDGRRDDTCVRCRKGPQLSLNEQRQVEENRKNLEASRARDAAWIEESNRMLSEQMEEFMSKPPPKKTRAKVVSPIKRVYRRSVSFRPQYFVAAKQAAEARGMPLAAYLESLLAADFDAAGIELPALEAAKVETETIDSRRKLGGVYTL